MPLQFLSMINDLHPDEEGLTLQQLCTHKGMTVGVLWQKVLSYLARVPGTRIIR